MFAVLLPSKLVTSRKVSFASLFDVVLLTSLKRTPVLDPSTPVLGPFCDLRKTLPPIDFCSEIFWSNYSFCNPDYQFNFFFFYQDVVQLFSLAHLVINTSHVCNIQLHESTRHQLSHLGPRSCHRFHTPTDLQQLRTPYPY